MKSKTKIILTSVVAFLVLLAVIAAGINAVYTVTIVRTDFVVRSTEGMRDAETLQTELDEQFLGKSTTFLKLEDVEETIGKYRNFRIESLQKKFPRAVELTLSEREEEIVFEVGSGQYAVLDADGVFLYEKDSLENRTGGRNVLLENFAFTVAENGTVDGEYFPEVVAVLSVLSEKLNSVRANVLSIRFDSAGADSNKNNHSFLISMREGVAIRIYHPSRYAAEKAVVAVEKYISLSDSERMFGRITALDYGTADEAVATYSPRDDF